MLPAPLYARHLVEEDLSQHTIGLEELKTYYKHLGLSLGLVLSAQQIDDPGKRSLARCAELQAESNLPLEQCLVRAVLEQTTQLELQAVKKGTVV